MTFIKIGDCNETGGRLVFFALMSLNLSLDPSDDVTRPIFLRLDKAPLEPQSTSYTCFYNSAEPGAASVQFCSRMQLCPLSSVLMAGVCSRFDNQSITFLSAPFFSEFENFPSLVKHIHSCLTRCQLAPTLVQELYYRIFKELYLAI